MQLKFLKYANQMHFRYLDLFTDYYLGISLITSIILYLIITRQGIGLSPDSINYLGVAENLRNGAGFLVPFGLPPNMPLAQFPPLLPIILASLSKLGISILICAKILNLILITSFIILVDKILMLIDKEKIFLRFAIVLLVSIYTSIQYIFTMLWSDPLMIVLGLYGFYFLYLGETNNNSRYILIAGLFFGFTAMSRYAGISFLISAVISILIAENHNLKTKILKSIFVSFPTFIFLTIWFSRESGSLISKTNRSISFHPFSLISFQEAVSSIRKWFLIPDSVPSLINIMVVTLITISILFLTRHIIWNRKIKENVLFEKIFIIFIFTYSFFLLFSISFIDANVPLDVRLLSPILFISLILVLALFKYINFKNHIIKKNNVIIAIIIVFFTIAAVFQNIPAIKESYKNGIGFNSLVWKESEAINFVKILPQPYLLISNAPEPIFLYTNQNVFSLPKKFLFMENKSNPDYSAQLNSLISQQLKIKTYFIFFKNIKGGNESEISQLQAIFNFNLVKIFSDANIYVYEPER